MKSETQTITVTINRSEALEIRNALLKGRGSDLRFEGKGAQDLFDLLGGNFESGITGVHTPRS